jgi:ribonuclease BN (tRNA processing enzyme)
VDGRSHRYPKITQHNSVKEIAEIVAKIKLENVFVSHYLKRSDLNASVKCIFNDLAKDELGYRIYNNIGNTLNRLLEVQNMVNIQTN